MAIWKVDAKEVGEGENLTWKNVQCANWLGFIFNFANIFKIISAERRANRRCKSPIIGSFCVGSPLRICCACELGEH